MKPFNFILLSLILSGCIEKRFPEENLTRENINPCAHKFLKLNECYELIWESKPTEEEYGEFKIKFSQAFDPEGELKVFLWMPSMGHGSSPVLVNELGSGTYLVSDVFFTMRGEWDIHIQINKENEIIDESIIHYPF